MHIHVGNMSILESLKIVMRQLKDINQRTINTMAKRKTDKKTNND